MRHSRISNVDIKIEALINALYDSSARTVWLREGMTGSANSVSEPELSQAEFISSCHLKQNDRRSSE